MPMSALNVRELQEFQHNAGNWDPTKLVWMLPGAAWTPDAIRSPDTARMPSGSVETGISARLATGTKPPVAASFSVASNNNCLTDYLFTNTLTVALLVLSTS